MKKQIKHGLLVGALLAGSLIPLHAQPALPGYPTGQTTNELNGTNDMGGTNTWRGRHERMHAMRQQWAAEIKQQDAELQQLATQMTNAPAGLKQDAIAAVVGKLVEDRLALHNRIEQMHQHMHPGDTNNP